MDRAKSEIIIIGPVAVGKTTIAGRLSEMVGLPLISMDEHRVKYYQELGYSREFADSLYKSQGAASLWCYVKAFDPYSIQRILEDHSHCVFDFGGGSAVHEHGDQLLRVKGIMEPYRNVVLLLPYPDTEKSLAFLDKRTGWGDKQRNVNRIILHHESMYELAKHTVYTADREVDDVCLEIIELCEAHT